MSINSYNYKTHSLMLQVFILDFCIIVLTKRQIFILNRQDIITSQLFSIILFTRQTSSQNLRQLFRANGVCFRDIFVDNSFWFKSQPIYLFQVVQIGQVVQITEKSAVIISLFKITGIYRIQYHVNNQWRLNRSTRSQLPLDRARLSPKKSYMQKLERFSCTRSRKQNITSKYITSIRLLRNQYCATSAQTIQKCYLYCCSELIQQLFFDHMGRQVFSTLAKYTLHHIAEVMHDDALGAIFKIINRTELLNLIQYQCSDIILRIKQLLNDDCRSEVSNLSLCQGYEPFSEGTHQQFKWISEKF
ncbi:Hypothetical_protein [Hexamita inflata]|uniref:Hypothetical_protein n=1 Tax=Hexamita inflata TaxID=28002 RepID=A0AA86U2H4_9EUKA|nr:Hypothetical protein HINF_LOCUS25051 [Hexamita inflata]